MSDHQTSYTINSTIGHLYLKNKAFQSLTFEGQQSIVLDIGLTQKPGFSTKNINLSRFIQVRNPE